MAGEGTQQSVEALLCETAWWGRGRVWTLESDPSPYPSSATYQFFDFGQVANFASLSFLVHRYWYHVMLTSLANGKIKRDSFLSHPHPQRSMSISWCFLSSSGMAHGPLGQGVACMPLLEPKPCWADITGFSAIFHGVEPELLCLASHFSQFGSRVHMDIMYPAGIRSPGPIGGLRVSKTCSS